mgnify:CR=1 FL=1
MLNSSLASTIHQIRPDLNLRDSYPKGSLIPEQMPQDYLDKIAPRTVVDIGEPTTACFLTTSRVDPTSWYLYFLLFLLSFAFFIPC